MTTSNRVSGRASLAERFAIGTVASAIVAPLALVLSVGVGLLFLPLLLLNAWVLMKLWGWFIVPGFGLPALSFVTAAGIVLIVRHIIPNKLPKKDERHDDSETAMVTSFSVIMPLYALCIGWFIHWVF